MFAPRLALALGCLVTMTIASAVADDKLTLAKKEIEDGGRKLGYRFLAPAAVEPGKKYPLVLFLHGAGERGDDNTAQMKHGIAAFVKPENRTKYPCFMIVPQCPKNGFWANVHWGAPKHTMLEKPSDSLRLTLLAVDRALKEQPIDSARVYVTGLSMGGYGTWEAISRRPDFFAAAMPVCGGGDEAQAEKITKVPLWAFHGDKDTAVPVARSRNMIEALKKAGGMPKYTEYPGVGHDSWTATYRDPEVLAWLFAQKRG